MSYSFRGFNRAPASSKSLFSFIIVHECCAATTYRTGRSALLTTSYPSSKATFFLLDVEVFNDDDDDEDDDEDDVLSFKGVFLFFLPPASSVPESRVSCSLSLELAV